MDTQKHWQPIGISPGAMCETFVGVDRMMTFLPLHMWDIGSVFVQRTFGGFFMQGNADVSPDDTSGIGRGGSGTAYDTFGYGTCETKAYVFDAYNIYRLTRDGITSVYQVVPTEYMLQEGTPGSKTIVDVVSIYRPGSTGGCFAVMCVEVGVEEEEVDEEVGAEADTIHYEGDEGSDDGSDGGRDDGDDEDMFEHKGSRPMRLTYTYTIEIHDSKKMRDKFMNERKPQGVRLDGIVEYHVLPKGFSSSGVQYGYGGMISIGRITCLLLYDVNDPENELHQKRVIWAYDGEFVGDDGSVLERIRHNSGPEESLMIGVMEYDTKENRVLGIFSRCDKWGKRSFTCSDLGETVTIPSDARIVLPSDPLIFGNIFMTVHPKDNGRGLEVGLFTFRFRHERNHAKVKTAVFNIMRKLDDMGYTDIVGVIGCRQIPRNVRNVLAAHHDVALQWYEYLLGHEEAPDDDDEGDDDGGD